MPKAYNAFGEEMSMEEANATGRMALRMPKSLHKQCVHAAELNGCSLNQYLLMIISKYVAEREAIERYVK